MLEFNKTYQGDAIDLFKEIPERSIDLIIADPPYGIDYQSNWVKNKKKPKIANDNEPFIRIWINHAFRVLKSPGAILCFCRWDTEEFFKFTLEMAGFEVKSEVIWDRVIHGMGDLNGQFAPCHDNILFGVKGAFKFPGIRPKSIIHIKRVDNEKLSHPNEKPVELMMELIKSLTTSDSVVLDPFAGSGSALIASYLMGRRFIGFEIEPRYITLINKRMERQKNARIFTG